MAAVCPAGWYDVRLHAIPAVPSPTLQLLRERGELDSRFGQATLGILLLQDIATVPFLVLLPLIEGSNSGGCRRAGRGGPPGWGSAGRHEAVVWLALHQGVLLEFAWRAASAAPRGLALPPFSASRGQGRGSGASCGAPPPPHRAPCVPAEMPACSSLPPPDASAGAPRRPPLAAALLEGSAQDTMMLLLQLGPAVLKTLGGLAVVLLGGRLLMRRCGRRLGPCKLLHTT